MGKWCNIKQMHVKPYLEIFNDIKLGKHDNLFETKNFKGQSFGLNLKNLLSNDKSMSAFYQHLQTKISNSMGQIYKELIQGKLNLNNFSNDDFKVILKIRNYSKKMGGFANEKLKECSDILNVYKQEIDNARNK